MKTLPWLVVLVLVVAFWFNSNELNNTVDRLKQCGQDQRELVAVADAAICAYRYQELHGEFPASYQSIPTVPNFAFDTIQRLWPNVDMKDDLDPGDQPTHFFIAPEFRVYSIPHPGNRLTIVYFRTAKTRSVDLGRDFDPPNTSN